jgi:serine protease Do
MKIILTAGTLILSTTLFAAPYPEPPDPPDPPQPVLAQAPAGSFLGVGVSEIDSERAKALNLREEHGVEITHIEDDGPAAKAGLHVGDVVLEYGGQRVEGTEQFVRLVHETPAGREVKLLLSRKGAQQTVALKTGSRKAWAVHSGDAMHFEFPKMLAPEFQMPDIPKTFMSWRNSSLGIEAESVENQLAQFFGVKEGVLIRSVIKGSAGDKAGLRAGDVIVKVDSTTVANPREVSAAIRGARSRKSVPVTVVREKREMSLNVPVNEDSSDSDKAEQSRHPLPANSVGRKD